jgi:hypothetical protein
MEDHNLKGKKRYIRLVDGPLFRPDFSQVEVIPQSQVAELSGKSWGWVWSRPSGVVLQQGDQRRRYPIFDLTRVLQILLYGLSLLFFLAGIHLILGKRKGA